MTSNNIWGPTAWKHLHFVALNYPSKPSAEDKHTYKQFIELFGKTLPCYMCSQNFSRHISNEPLTDNTLKDNHSLFNWTVRLHNMINKELGKSQMNEKIAYKLYNNPQTPLSKKTILLAYTSILAVYVFLIFVGISLYKSKFV